MSLNSSWTVVLQTNWSEKNKRKLEDILSWSGAFSIFTLVLASHFPTRWKDLMLYKLIIIRTHRYFGGRAWLTYDQAFREHAAATNLTDWSEINVQLYNFHIAGSSSRPSDTICISWNKGRCTTPYPSCRYAHKCSNFSGNHRSIDCRRSRHSASKNGRSDSPSKSSRPKARKT